MRAAPPAAAGRNRWRSVPARRAPSPAAPWSLARGGAGVADTNTSAPSFTDSRAGSQRATSPAGRLVGGRR
jgi:hypothetical protein